MPPRPFLMGQKRSTTFRNKYTKFFFNELDKGITSPYILLFIGGLGSLLAYRVTENYLEPRREQLARRKLVPRVPLDPAHNTFWGLGSRDAGEVPDPSTVVALGEVHSEGIYAPQTSDAGGEEKVQHRPHLIHTEPSELRSKSGEVDIVCLELPEYDPAMRDDIYYRSVHYVNLNEPLAQDKAATSSVAEATDDYASNDNYLQFVPGKGEEFVHGLVKCKAVTSENNCVPYAGQVEEEITRKFALTLGPVHILRDAAKLVAPWRLTFVKQPQIETLIVGLHGGGLPRWLSSAFPNFNVDVVERDGSLARVCRNYLGFRESSNLRLWIGDPEDYIRHVAVQGLTKDTDGRTAKEASSKRYDLVMIDAIDGNGNLSSRYGRLEFINSVRNAMSNAGCVAIALPNQQGQFVYNMVQNWRMGFTGRTVVLVHCMTSPVTMLMTFQDNAERGKANIGSVANVDEFSDLLRSHLKHYGPNRVPFDLTGEINRDNFKVLEPGRSYDLAAYLPPGHPDVGKRSKEKKSGGGIQEWLKRASQSLLSPAMKDDIKRNGI